MAVILLYLSNWYLLCYVQIHVVMNVLQKKKHCCYYCKTLEQLGANPFQHSCFHLEQALYQCQTLSPHVMLQTKPIYSALPFSLPVLPSHTDTIWISNSDSDSIEMSTLRMFPHLNAYKYSYSRKICYLRTLKGCSCCISPTTFSLHPSAEKHVRPL